MSGTTQSQHCGKCGATLSGYAPDGLCAACLLESAFAERDVPSGELGKPAQLFALKDYELVEELARGGMGVVYRARQISLSRPVAIKMILGGHLANAAEMHRFRAEAETAAQLQHPNIVAIHEVGEHAGQPFFSMDLVQGQNLAQLVRDEPLPSRKAATYLKTIAEAVQYAHSHGVLHRDLKSSNILIDENDQPRVTDFGLAKHFSTSAGTLPTASQSGAGEAGDAVERVPAHVLTQTGQVLGSPSFIPPEQAAGQKDRIGPASDVYSLGAILYHCLTARPPFVAETLTQTLRMVAEQEPVSPHLLNASVPGDLETICLKCLEKDPAQRYPTARALGDDVNRFLNNEPIHAHPVGLVLKIHRWCLRNKALAASGTTALALLLVVAIGSPIAAFRINRERQQAEANQQKAQQESAKSQQVAKFLQDMLAGIDPNVAKGRDTTLLRELLDKAAERINHDLLDQPEVRAHLQNTIGHVYQGISELTKAEMIHRDALAARRRLLGDKHPDVAESLFWLARDLWMQGKVAEAEGPAREALTLRLEFFGKNHLLVADSLSLLGLVVQWQNKPAEAEALFRESLKIQRTLVGNEHLDVARSLVYLSFALADQKKQTEAEQLNREALGILRSLPGDMPPFIARVLYGMGSAAFDQGNYPEAEALFREVLVLRKKYYGDEHLETATTWSSLGSALNRQRKFAEAETSYRECLAIRGKKFPDAWYTFYTQSLLGETLLSQRKYSEAEPLLLSGYEGMKQREENIRGGNQALKSALQRLVQLYETTGQSNKVAEWK